MAKRKRRNIKTNKDEMGHLNPAVKSIISSLQDEDWQIITFDIK